MSVHVTFSSKNGLLSEGASHRPGSFRSHPNFICIQNCGRTSRGLIDDRHASAAVAPPDASLECRVRAHRPTRLLLCGPGLNLRVDPSGARRWVQRLVILGRPRMLGLGGYPLVSLAEARDVAFAHRKQARAGGDPLTEQRHAPHVPTVEEAAAAVLEQQRPGWRNARYGQAWPRSLRVYAFPRIGTMPVSDVTTADVLAILTPIWHDKPETARRVRQRIGAVMKWAIAMGPPTFRYK